MNDEPTADHTGLSLIQDSDPLRFMSKLGSAFATSRAAGDMPTISFSHFVLPDGSSNYAAIIIGRRGEEEITIEIEPTEP